MVTTSSALRVLIVDAQPDAARNLTLLLSQWGHDPKYATSSWQALEIVGHWRPEVVFLDAALPVTNGYQLAKMIRGRFAAREIKLFIAAERKTQAPPPHERFFDGLLLKPVAIQKVREALQSCAGAGA